MEVKDCKTKWIRTTCFGAAFIVGGFGSNPVGAAFGILGLLVEQTEETHCICAEGRGCSDAIVNMQEIIDAQNRGDIFVPTPVYEVRCVRYWKSLLGSTCAESRICDQCN
jgi:hypothetical protein